MSTIQDLKEQISTLRRRKSERELQSARYGILADPAIRMEIKDILVKIERIEEAIRLIERVEAHRQRLGFLANQAKELGAHTPAHVPAEIQSVRAEIRTLKTALARMGHGIDDHPLDEEEQNTRVAVVGTVAIPTDPWTHVRRRLRDIEALARFGDLERVIQALVDLQREIG